jgi:hypothetical protein
MVILPAPIQLSGNVYTNFIPNLMLTRQFSKTMNSNLTYTFALAGHLYNLNPFVNNSDSLNISFGNPTLDPNTCTILPGRTGFSKAASLYLFRRVNFANNLIIQNPTFDSATGITSVTGKMRDRSGISPSALSPIFLLAKWNFAVNATGRFARMRNKLQTPWSNTTAGNVNANITYKATKLFTIASNSGYFAPLRMPNITFPDNYFYGFNFIFKVFKEKMNLNASVTNFFEKERKLNFLQKIKFHYREHEHHTLQKFWTCTEL